MELRKLSILLLFYKHYCLAPLIVSLCCYVLYLQHQDIVQQLAIKIFTTGVTLFLIAAMQKDKLYYYYNLHASKRLLLAGYFITDLFIFSTVLWLTALMHR